MTKHREYKGMWFLPDKPDIKVAGTLYFYPNENIKLELLGSLSEMTGNALFYQQDKKFSIIHGMVYGDNKAERITLFDCFSSWKYNFTCQFALTTFYCTYMFVGKYINTKNEKLFDKIQVTFPCLRDWYPYRSIGFSVMPQKKCQWEISESEKNKKTFPIDTQTILTLYTCAGFETAKSGYNLREDSFIEIESKEKSSFSELYHKISLFRDFLSLSVLNDVPFLTITLYENDDYQEFKDSSKDIHTTQLFFITKKGSTDKYPTYDYLFKFNDIESEFGNIIAKWYSESERLAPIRTHLINSISYKKHLQA